MFNQIINKNSVNMDTTSGSYESCRYYDDNVMQKTYFPNQFDGWRDNRNYGIIYKNNIIYPKKSSLKNYVNDSGGKHQNLLFVVDAFREMKNYIRERATKEQINDASSTYTLLDVKESIVDVESLYLTHLNKTTNIFFNVFLPDVLRSGTIISNVQSFAKQFARFISFTTKVAPFNRHLFIGSSIVPQSINGLTISFETQLNPLDLITKANSFVNQDTFQEFSTIAKRFGFSIDRNFPWRIVADLNSPGMKNYYSAYSLKSEEEIFEKLYHKAYMSDLVSLKNVFITYWNKYVQTTGVISVKSMLNCTNGFGEIITLKFLNEELFDYYFDINWLLRLYLYIRILEDNINISQNKFEAFHEKVCNINKIYNLEKALKYIIDQLKILKPAGKQEIFYDLTNSDSIDKVMKQTLLSTPPSMLIF